MKLNNSDSLFFTEKEAAYRLGIAPITLRRWRWSGLECPPYVRIGAKLIKYPTLAFAEYVSSIQRGEIIPGTVRADVSL